LVTSPSAVALADGDCPPGSWFCEETNVKAPPQAQQQDEADEQETATTPQDAPLPKKKHKKKKAPPTDVQAGQGGVELHTQGPVVIYTQGQPQVQTPPAAPQAQAMPAPPPPPPAKKKRKWRERFGLNLRGEGAAFASAYGGTSAMGGIGLSYRYRPVPMFALDIGGDVLGGKDYYKNARIESAFAVTGMLYLNPGSHVQVYALGGLNLAHAAIDNGYRNGFYDTWETTQSHDYIGGHAGLGLEFRVSRHVGLDVDGIGLIRHRIDGGPAEFQDPKTGRTTDTSAAGLFRGGITFWW
jgi:opacity protein-like surface antigen